MKLFILSAFLFNTLSSPVLAGFTEGVAAYRADNMPLAFKEFRAAAEEGHADARFNLGLMYENGIGVSRYNNVLMPLDRYLENKTASASTN